jgi:hypothetical protein
VTSPDPTGQAPAPTTATTGQAPANPAQPAPAGGETPPWTRDGQPFDPARAWSLIENLRADLATARNPAPTPPPKPTDPPPADGAGLAGQLDELRGQLARERAARRHGLDDDLVDLLGAGTSEQIDARAKALTDRLTAAAQPTGSPVPRRPVEQLRGGADPTTPPDETDPAKLADLIRGRSLF